MNQVDFYLISNRVNDARYKLASRLCNKLQRQQQSSLVVTDNVQATTELDRVMWSFSDTSFLAHDLFNNVQAGALTHIGDHHSVSPAVLAQKHRVLVNLSSGIPAFHSQFSRIAEIVDADDNSKAAARIRYKRYQENGYTLKMHTIEL